MLALFASIGLQELLASSANRDLAASFNDDTLGGEFSQMPSINAVTNGFIGLVVFLVSAWLFTLIVRFTRTREAAWLARDWDSIRAILMTILYAIGIFIFVVLVGMVTTTMVILSFNTLFDYIQTPRLVGSPAVIGFFFALIPSLLQHWLLLRFLVGLPAVSFGNSPRFFRDFWPLAKGESWGLPLRMFLPGLLAIVLTAAILYPALLPITILAMWPSSSQSGPAIEFLMIAESTGWLRYFAASLIIVLVPIFWFFTLLLTTAYHRFSQRQQRARRFPLK